MVMKTDLVLTMDEYLKGYCLLGRPITPPAKDARHVPITVKDNANIHPTNHGCRCDRWGHPCADCTENGKRDAKEWNT
jgi:hypothetical protein